MTGQESARHPPNSITADTGIQSADRVNRRRVLQCVLGCPYPTIRLDRDVLGSVFYWTVRRHSGFKSFAASDFAS
jgi:hypothetical protein